MGPIIGFLLPNDLVKKLFRLILIWTSLPAPIYWYSSARPCAASDGPRPVPKERGKRPSRRGWVSQLCRPVLYRPPTTYIARFALKNNVLNNLKTVFMKCEKRNVTATISVVIISWRRSWTFALFAYLTVAFKCVGLLF